MNSSNNGATIASSVRFIHLSDSHVQHDDPASRHLHRLYAAVKTIEQLVEDGVPIDFVVHTGDLVDDADYADANPAPTRLALEVLAGLSVPWFMLGGNHDRQDFLERASGTSLPLGCMVSAPHPDKSARRGQKPSSGIVNVPFGDLQLLFINLNPEDGKGDLHGRVSPLQINRLERLLIDPDLSGRFAIFSHYPLLAQEAGWTGRPEGAEQLVELLERHAKRIAGVFAGHVHRGIHHMSNGVLHVSAPSLSRHFLLWPGQDVHAYIDDDLIGWHYVTLDASGTRVQQHVFNLSQQPSSTGSNT